MIINDATSLIREAQTREIGNFPLIGVLWLSTLSAYLMGWTGFLARAHISGSMWDTVMGRGPPLGQPFGPISRLAFGLAIYAYMHFVLDPSTIKH